MKKKKIKISKKAQKVLDALLEKAKCPKCRANYGSDGIGWAEEGENTWRIMLEEDDLGYDKDEFAGSDEGYFYCRNCGSDADLSREEVIRILKHYEQEETK